MNPDQTAPPVLLSTVSLIDPPSLVSSSATYIRLHLMTFLGTYAYITEALPSATIVYIPPTQATIVKIPP